VRYLKICAEHYETHWDEKEKALECIYKVAASEAA